MSGTTSDPQAYQFVDPSREILRVVTENERLMTEETEQTNKINEQLSTLESKLNSANSHLAVQTAVNVFFAIVTLAFLVYFAYRVKQEARKMQSSVATRVAQEMRSVLKSETTRSFGKSFVDYLVKTKSS